MEFFSETHLDHRAAEAIARGLFAVAHVDGIHPREAALIASFWIDTGGGTDALAELERGATITAQELATALHGVERTLFLKTAILLAWADGKVTDAERRIDDGFARALGCDAAALGALEASVKEFLLSHVSHLSNTEAAAKVARKLGV
jgi:tellurite resistance protein